MNTLHIEDTSREHTAFRAGMKAGNTLPPFERRIAPPIPVPRNPDIPWTEEEGEGSLHVGGPEAEGEHMFIDSDDIANHDFPIPPLSQHRVEGRVTEEMGKTGEERVRPGGKPGSRPGDRHTLGFTPTIMDQNKTFASQDGDVEPQNDFE